MPSTAASRYTSLRTQPAAARWSRCPPVKSASIVTFALDHDTRIEQMRFAQLTPAGSGCSIVIGNLPAQTEMAPGSMRGLKRCVADAAAAREELLGRGGKASEITVFDERDGGTFFGFSDPDGKHLGGPAARGPCHQATHPHREPGPLRRGLSRPTPGPRLNGAASDPRDATEHGAC